MDVSDRALRFMLALQSNDLDLIDQVLAEGFRWECGLAALDKPTTLLLFRCYFRAFSNWETQIHYLSEQHQVLQLEMSFSGCHDATLDLSALGIPLHAEASGYLFDLPALPSLVYFEGPQAARLLQPTLKAGALQDILDQLGLVLGRSLEPKSIR